MGTAALAGCQQWADGRLRCRRAKGNFLRLAGEEWGAFSSDWGAGRGADSGAPGYLRNATTSLQ